MTPSSQPEKGVRVRLFEDAVERTISKLASNIKPGLVASHFKLPDKVVSGFHLDMVSSFKHVANEEVKNFLEENNCEVWKKLNQLDKIEENTTAKPGHVAWRPSGNPADTLRAIEGVTLRKHLGMLKDLHAKLQSDTHTLIANVKQEREALTYEELENENFLNVLGSFIKNNRRFS